MKNEKEYTPAKTFRKGDVIYHPVLKDKGKITKINQAPSNKQKLYVQFEKKGSKVLIAGRETGLKNKKNGD